MDEHERRPHESEVDLYGLTHVGRVRENNEDNFIVCSFRKEIDVHYTSLPSTSPFENIGERLGFLAAVADGVGGSEAGEVASRRSLEILASYASSCIQTYIANDLRRESEFVDQLRTAVMEAHANIVSEASRAAKRMMTTITMLMTRWPTGYVVQVGDSRCYVLRNGELYQVSKDQTLAQDLVDAGAGNVEQLNKTWGHVLSSSMGGKVISPVITKVDVKWNDLYLLCSDGLTGHVSDDQIREILLASSSAQQACEELVQAALVGGGSDNITVVIGSPRRP